MLNALIGLILGVFAATFSSSLFFRLPRNIDLYGFLDNKLKPFCSKCNHPLKFFEYYSFLSWFSCRGRCNYCGDKIDFTFFILEFFIILSSVLSSYFYGISDKYIINVFITIILSSISLTSLCNHKIPGSLYLSLVFLSILKSSYFDAELMDVSMNLAIAGFLIMLFTKFTEKSRPYIDSILVIGISFVYLSGDFVLYFKYLVSSICIFITFRVFRSLQVIKNISKSTVALFAASLSFLFMLFL